MTYDDLADEQEMKILAFKRDLEALLIEHGLQFVAGSWGNPTRIEILEDDYLNKLSGSRLKTWK